MYVAARGRRERKARSGRKEEEKVKTEGRWGSLYRGKGRMQKNLRISGEIKYISFLPDTENTRVGYMFCFQIGPFKDVIRLYTKQINRNLLWGSCFDWSKKKPHLS